MEAIVWDQGRVRLLDQRGLPEREVYLEMGDYRQVAAAIREMRVRGAPLIGIAAAYGLVLAARQLKGASRDEFLAGLVEAAAYLAATRPTAVNLAWALKRLMLKAEACATPGEGQELLLEEALRIHREDIEANRRMGRFGAELLPQGISVLTHCNTGALATGGYGTALGVITTAWQDGKVQRVYVTETRPLLQGARLTVWELSRAGIPATLIVDSAAGLLLSQGKVGAVIVGADRIAAQGDVANKIGTYSLAVLAKENKVSFYVAAPTSTVDLATPSGREIPIEERSDEEVKSFGGRPVAPTGVAAANPAFDVTPHQYLTAIITENGVARPPYQQSLAELMKESSHV